MGFRGPLDVVGGVLQWDERNSVIQQQFSGTQKLSDTRDDAIIELKVTEIHRAMDFKQGLRHEEVSTAESAL